MLDCNRQPPLTPSAWEERGRGRGGEDMYSNL